MDVSRNSEADNSVNETFVSTNAKFSFGNSIKKVFITFDRDLAHKLFGYRLRFLPEEMKFFAAKGKPISQYSWQKLNMEEQE